MQGGGIATAERGSSAPSGLQHEHTDFLDDPKLPSAKDLGRWWPETKGGFMSSSPLREFRSHAIASRPSTAVVLPRPPPAVWTAVAPAAGTRASGGLKQTRSSAQLRDRPKGSTRLLAAPTRSSSPALRALNAQPPQQRPLTVSATLPSSAGKPPSLVLSPPPPPIGTSTTLPLRNSASAAALTSIMLPASTPSSPSLPLRTSGQRPSHAASGRDPSASLADMQTVVRDLPPSIASSLGRMEVPPPTSGTDSPPHGPAQAGAASTGGLQSQHGGAAALVTGTARSSLHRLEELDTSSRLAHWLSAFENDEAAFASKAVRVWACHERAWACMGVHGRAWACMGVRGRAWACMGMHPWACMGVWAR